MIKQYQKTTLRYSKFSGFSQDLTLSLPDFKIWTYDHNYWIKSDMKLFLNLEKITLKHTFLRICE